MFLALLYIENKSPDFFPAKFLLHKIILFNYQCFDPNGLFPREFNKRKKTLGILVLGVTP